MITLLMVVIPKQGPNAESTNDLVHDLRDYHKDAQDKYGFKTEISDKVSLILICLKS